MLSPAQGHKDYQRFKYYSALRTGYAHLGIEEPSLEPPSHVIDKELFVFQSPFGKYSLLLTAFLWLLSNKYLVFVIECSIWGRLTQFNGRGIQLLEDYDWYCCGHAAICLPAIRYHPRLDIHFHELFDIVLHLQTDH